MGKQLPDLRKVEEMIDSTKREITPDNIKKVYQFLEKKQAEPISFLIESLVGMMRNIKSADTKSVQMYLQKHEGFMIGLNRLKLRELNFEYCKDYLYQLRDKYNKLILSEEFEIFHLHRKLLSLLC